MTSPSNDHPDRKRQVLRVLLADLERAISELAIDEPPEGVSHEVRAACQRMAAAMDLGPEPAVRRCPHCGHTGMRAATLCGHCWEALPPAAPVTPDAPQVL